MDMGRAGDALGLGFVAGRLRSRLFAWPRETRGSPRRSAESWRRRAIRTVPGPTNVFFGDRGSQEFAGYGVLDMSFNYNVPVFRTLRPWVKFDVYNLFNNQKLIAWNTTISQDPASPKDSLGYATGYIKGPDVRDGDGEYGDESERDDDQRVSGRVQWRHPRRPHASGRRRIPILSS